MITTIYSSDSLAEYASLSITTSALFLSSHVFCFSQCQTALYLALETQTSRCNIYSLDDQIVLAIKI